MASSSHSERPSPMQLSTPTRASSQPRHHHSFRGASPVSNYEMMEKLGEGTFGEVWKARGVHTKELFALKKILMHNEKEGFPVTALREIKLLKSLNHENVIGLTEMAIERGSMGPTVRKRGSVFMVTPYMDHDLAGLLENPAVRLKVPHIKCYFKQLLQGTAYLHDMKILHRDMKAANLLINNHGILKIADFGLARTYDEPSPRRGKATQPAKREYTNCVVTRWYRPPEILLGETRYGPSVDMWGVGCVYAEMMRTKPLIEGRSDLDQLYQIFRMCGSPTPETMPGYDSLPGVIDDVKVSFQPHHERILEREMARFLHNLGVNPHTVQLAVDLLSKLLLLDPLKRISAVDALEHPYFTAVPLPSRPGDLPVYEASHELTRRKREARARAPRGAHQVNDGEPRDHDRRHRVFDGDMPTSWGGGSGMAREDSGRGFRRGGDFDMVDRFRPRHHGDSWVAARDGRRERSRDRRGDGRDRENRKRSRSPDERDREPRKRSRTPDIKEAAPEVKYGRR